MEMGNTNSRNPNFLYGLIEQNNFKEAKKFLRDKKISQNVKLENLHFEADRGSTCLNELVRNVDVTNTSLIQSFIDIGGDELLFQKDSDGDSALHIAFWCGSSFDIIRLLSNEGGQELVTMKDGEGCTALQIACRTQDSLDVIKHLISIGGVRMVHITSNYGWNCLHEACDAGMSLEIVKYLVEIGGREIMQVKDKSGWNPFFWVCDSSDSLGLGRTYNRAQLGIVKFLLDTFGESLVGETDTYKDIPIQIFVRSSIGTTVDLEVLKALLLAGITRFSELDHLVGGLFVSFPHSTQNQPTEASSVLERLLIELSPETLFQAIEDVVQKSPLLQAAIVANVSTHCTEQIIHFFPQAISTKNSEGLLPIQTAVRADIGWDEGIKVLFDAYSQDELSMFIAAAHGLQWENGTKYITQEYLKSWDMVDPNTNLYPFVLAAAGDETDLTSIYELMRLRIDLVINHLNYA